jgi:ubiquinone/menaquinone biosynthesis C-methylase UbiE
MGQNQLALKMTLKQKDLKRLKFNHAYWEKNAAKYKTSHSVSWGDANMIQLEIKNILNYIEDGDYVLDAGCSNGYSTFTIAAARDIQVKAFDYSKKSIEYAVSAQYKKDKERKIKFYHGNILNIDESDNTFDKVYTIRVIINLLSWNLQKRAIKEMYRVLKPGGLFLMSEAFMGSLRNLNKLRALANLPPLTVHDFNLYLEERKTEKFLQKYFNIVEIKKFSSIYYVASRFLRYLTMKKQDKDTYINDINNFFAKFEETENSGDFGIQKLYVLRKRSISL